MPLMPQQLLPQKIADPPAFLPRVGSKRGGHCPAEDVSGSTLINISELPTSSNNFASGVPEQRNEFAMPASQDSGLPTAANVSGKPNCALLTPSRSVELTSWRSLIGFPGIRRSVAAAVWSPATYAYYSAISVASTFLPYFWDTNPVEASQDLPTYCTKKQLSADSPAACTRDGPSNSGAEDPAAPLSPATVLAHVNPMTCIKCPHCSGTFRWQDAEHVREAGRVDVSFKRSSPQPTQEGRAATCNTEAATDVVLQPAGKALSQRKPTMWNRRRRSDVESPIVTSNSNGEAAGYSSEVQSAQVFVETRQPRWIRFLVKRLKCIHMSNDRRVLESRQNSQQQRHVGRHRRLRLRHRRRLTKETLRAKERQGALEDPVLAHAEAEHNGSRAGLDRSSVEVHYESSNCLASMRQVSESAVPISSVTPGSGDVGAGTAGMHAVKTPSSCGSFVGDASRRPAGSPESTDQAKGMGSQPSAGGTAAEPLPTQMPACVRDSQDVEVGLWPLVSLKAMDMRDIRDAFHKLEEQRLRFNSLHRQTPPPLVNGSTWNSQLEMQRLSKQLVNASIPLMLVLDCGMPCVHCHDGLQVWKGESAVGSFACRGLRYFIQSRADSQMRYCMLPACFYSAARFLLPVEPRLYAMFASNSELRCQWDKNVTEQHVVEHLEAGRDVCYVAFRRIATLYPRDLVTLRVKCRLPMRPKVADVAADLADGYGFDRSCAKVRSGSQSETDMAAYSSMSCSIDHPDAPEL